MAENDETMAMMPMSVVIRMSSSEMPSMPKSYFTPSGGIQLYVSRNCHMASPVALRIEVEPEDERGQEVDRRDGGGSHPDRALPRGGRRTG